MEIFHKVFYHILINFKTYILQQILNKKNLMIVIHK